MWKVILGTWMNALAVPAGKAECYVTQKYAPLPSARHQPGPKGPAASAAMVFFQSGNNSKLFSFVSKTP